MVVLRLPARPGGLCKSLENESDFTEIHAVFGKSLEINKTDSTRRVLCGVMGFCILCNSWGFTPLGGYHATVSIPSFLCSLAFGGGGPVVPNPRRGVGTRDNPPSVSEISFFPTDRTAS